MAKGKKVWMWILVLVVLIFSCIPITFAVETQITSDTADQQNAVIYGDIRVWQDKRKGDWDIYMCDLALNGNTGGCLEDDTKTQILTTDPADQSADQRYPTIYGNRIVWEDDRNGNYDIYMYDLSTDTETGAVVDAEKCIQRRPAIYEDKIVYMNQYYDIPLTACVGGMWEINKYDLGTGFKVSMSGDPGPHVFPSIYDQRIVWIIAGTTMRDIYWSPTAFPIITQLTTTGTIKSGTVIYGDRVVWYELDDAKGTYDVYMYDFGTGTETQITTDPDDQTYPAIYDNKIVWEDRRDGNANIYMCVIGDNCLPADPNYNAKTPITTDTADQKNPSIYGDRIVYEDFRNGNWDIYMYTPPTCDDNTLNQDETDVDCGGVCGATCLEGQSCLSDSDCVSNNCDTGGTNICQPSLPCTITSAYWITPDLTTTLTGAYIVSNKTSVSLYVAGVNCNGQTVAFEIWEDDLVGDDLAVIIPELTGTFAGITLTIPWNAVYPTFDSIGDPTEIGRPEYYFKAILGDGTEFTSTKKLKVTGNLPPEKPVPFLEEPVGGEVYDQYAIIKWNPASDPDNDPLEYKIEYSSDSGANWNTLVENYGYVNTVEYMGVEKESLTFDFD